jgi:iron complex outermembrane receptor protein
MLSKEQSQKKGQSRHVQRLRNAKLFRNCVMDHALTRPVSCLGIAVLLAGCSWSSVALANDASDAAPVAASAVSSDGGAIIVTGTRSSDKRARDSSSPVSVVSAAAIKQSGAPDLSAALTRIYPSLNIQAQAGNADALTATVQMRGLNPNHVLVLVDGVRRHSSSNIQTYGGVTYGSTPVDLNMIPTGAIDHVEVLEDGAAAQYGSDAIAGVINIITKKKASGFNVSASTGGNANNNDGFMAQLDLDGGMKLGSDGYLHVSGQVMHRALSVIKVVDHRFIESQAPAGAYTSIGYTGTTPVDPYSNHVSNVPAEQRESVGLTFGKPIAGSLEAYGMATFAHRHAESPQQYRLPTIVPSVYPNGFTPIDVSNEDDFAVTLGLKGKNFLGFQWDASSTLGYDIIKLSAKNNINLGMLASTCVSSATTPNTVYSSDEGCGYAKTNFFLKGFSSGQWDNKLDLVRKTSLFGLPLNLAFGGEHRLELYDLTAGEPASYQVGGTQAIAGLTPKNAGKWTRTIWAGYLDTDFKLLPQWDLDLAGRFENYTDTGSTFNGKASMRYDVSPRFGLRGTISNGFRAPTLAEQHFSSATMSPTSAGGLLPASSAAALALGATPLKPERSTNYSAGIVLQPIPRLHVEIDAYMIEIRNRIVRSNSISGQSAVDALGQFGFTVPSSISLSNVTVNYLTNGADTRTRGLDIKADYTLDLENWGTLALTAAANLNSTHVMRVASGTNGKPLLNAQSISLFTTEYPVSKILLGANWSTGKWTVNLRETRYGHTTGFLTYQDWAVGTCADGSAQRYSTTCFGTFRNGVHYMTDVEVGYKINSRITAAIGANNLFSERPTTLPTELQYNGVYKYDQYSSSIPMTGGYYYGRLSVSL